MKKYKSGYYWVQLEKDEMIIAHNKSGDWYITGSDLTYGENEFEILEGPLIPPSE